MRIFVGNLSYSTSENDLQVKFAEYGTVEEAKIILDRDTGRSRGFGFVSMPDDTEAKAAIEALNSTEVDGRPLRVDEAHARRDSGSTGERRW